jgi:hypothetical protein
MAMVGATCVERDRIRRTAGVRVARKIYRRLGVDAGRILRDPGLAVCLMGSDAYPEREP